MDNMSLSDIAAVTRGNDNDGWGQGGAWWIIILFLFVFMGGNGLWGNRTGEYGQYATAASQQEILYGQQFGQLNDRLTNIGNGICNLGYEMQGNIGQLGKEVALAQAGRQHHHPVGSGLLPCDRVRYTGSHGCGHCDPDRPEGRRGCHRRYRFSGCGHCGCTDQSGIDFPGAQCVRLRKLYPELPADRYCCRGEQYGCGRGKTVRGRTWL